MSKLTVYKNGKYYACFDADEGIRGYLPRGVNLRQGVDFHVGTLEGLISYCYDRKDMDGMWLISHIALDKDAKYSLREPSEDYVVFSDDTDDECYFTIDEVELMLSPRERAELDNGVQIVLEPKNISTLIKSIKDMEKHDVLVDMLEGERNYLIEKVNK